MRKVIVADVDRIDFQNSLEDVHLVDSESERDSDGTLLIDRNNYGNVLDLKNAFIPSSMFRPNDSPNGLHVYFELELYPFFQKVRDVITSDPSPKGVFRLRRIMKNKNELIIADDLYVLDTVFGKPECIYVKQTNRNVSPHHVIVTVNFGGGTMAHLDYTFSNEDLIELEWSGNKKIIEFSSTEMHPVEPAGNSSLPLSYNVDSILALSHKVDGEIMKRHKYLTDLVQGGDQQ
ncbi:hypothetical protein ACFO3D_06520 [Virgibacillus kekensis]|uniref:Uncharacterized protein n=1 Tax=Virgibacillus kekensis TaxID=202261 RepID=A0ABV9DJ63_9BACI